MNKREFETKLINDDLNSLLDELTEELENGYEELLMVQIVKTYYKMGDLKSAKKVLRKLDKLFPFGNHSDERSDLSNLINGVAEESKKVNSENIGSVGHVMNMLLSKNSLVNDIQEEKLYSVVENAFANVVGMKSVKRELNTFYKLLKLQRIRKDNGFEGNDFSRNFVIVGNPGSGKSMLSKIIEELLVKFELHLSNPATEVPAYLLTTADGLKTVSAGLAAFQDGIVIVEDFKDIFATEGSINDTTRFIMETITGMVKKNKDRISFVFTMDYDTLKKLETKYTDFLSEMGCIAKIEPYSADELFDLFKLLAQKRSLRVHETANNKVREIISKNMKSAAFENSKTLNILLNKAKNNMAKRVDAQKTHSEEDLVYLLSEDFDLDSSRTLDELLNELNSMVGLNGVKEQVKRRIEEIKVLQLSKEKGAERKNYSRRQHMLFLGNPGTGKTSVAGILGKIYGLLGAIPDGDRMITCQRDDLVGDHVGETAKKVNEKVKEALGGILFIDEAYSLCRDKNDTFGVEAVNMLVDLCEKYRDDFIVIMAGYEKEVEEFLEINPGMKSRFPNRIIFEDYSEEEMVEIFKVMVKNAGMSLEAGTDSSIERLISEASRVPDFANARGVSNTFDMVCANMNSRLYELSNSDVEVSKEQYETITKEDIEKCCSEARDDSKSLEDLLDELDSMVGLASVKRSVHEAVDRVRVQKYMKERGMERSGTSNTMHMLFIGNAGTGKTSVARLVGKIYRKLGLLSKNVFIETKGIHLLAEYQGQTGPKVISLLDQADGGILFIDEAYGITDSASRGNCGSFGEEAINTLVPELENRRDHLMVIFAGYEKEMDAFMTKNQGLASRIPNIIRFEDYSAEEMLAIFKMIIAEKGLHMDDELDESVLQLIKRNSADQQDFGNGRGVRNLVEKIDGKRYSRISKELMQGYEPNEIEISNIVEEDLI